VGKTRGRGRRGRGGGGEEPAYQSKDCSHAPASL